MPDIRYKHNLPHIHPEGFPLFVTIRLADSLPLDVLVELKIQRERELNARENLSSSDRYDIEKRHFGRYDNWLDRCANGPRWLESETIAGIVMDKILSMDVTIFMLVASCLITDTYFSILLQWMKGNTRANA